VLNEKRSAARFGVPVGALVTPVPSCEGLSPLPLVRGRAPLVCSECGAFVNLYCKVPPCCAPHTSYVQPVQPLVTTRFPLALLAVLTSVSGAHHFRRPLIASSVVGWHCARTVTLCPA